MPALHAVCLLDPASSNAIRSVAARAENGRRQVEAARDAAIALADQTVPLLKDAMTGRMRPNKAAGVRGV